MTMLLPIAMGSLPSPAAALLQPSFKAEPIEFTAVDHDTGAPLGDVTATAIWQYRAGMEGGSNGHFVNVLETASGKDGKIRFPGWGPVSLRARLQPTTVYLFKSGYLDRGIDNDPSLSNEEQQNFEHNGRIVKLKRHAGTPKQYAWALDRFSYELWSRIQFLGKPDEPHCDWRRFPLMLRALSAEERRLRSEDSATFVNFLPTKLANNDAQFVKQGCGSPKAFLEGLPR